MKRIWLIALTSALATSTMALAVDDASAVTRAGVSRAGVHRVGVNRVGVNRVGINRAGIGYGRAGIGYGRALANRGGWNGYYRPGLGVAAGEALGAAAAASYYGDSSYRDSYASAAYGTADYGGGDVYTLRGATMSEAEAIAYCAQSFRSYDLESRTFLAYSGERVSCPQ